LKTYHFYAQYSKGDTTHHFDGVLETELNLRHLPNYHVLKQKIADAMTPPRPSAEIVVRSFTLVAED